MTTPFHYDEKVDSHRSTSSLNCPWSRLSALVAETSGTPRSGYSPAMCSAPDDVLSAPPDDVAPAAVLLFRADLATVHPLRTSDACPADLDALLVPQQLIARLKAWTRYFSVSFSPADGWSSGAPEPWWLSERDALPRDIATLFGPVTAVRIAGGYVHTREPALSEQATAALARLAVEIGDTQDDTPAADGTSFAFIASTSRSPAAD